MSQTTTTRRTATLSTGRTASAVGAMCSLLVTLTMLFGLDQLATHEHAGTQTASVQMMSGDAAGAPVA